MFENEAKGWHGSYSTAGRNSAEKYHIIIHKDEILSNEPKKIRIKDIFTPDEPQPVESLEDNIDIFKVYSNDQKSKISFVPKSQNLSKKAPEKVDRLKYHNKHMKEGDKRKKIAEPPCTSYHPKYSFIWSRTITGPKWKILRGRDKKPLPVDTKDFYIHNSEGMQLTSKCFINMKKQTQRGEFTEAKDVRIRTDKPYGYKTTKSSPQITSNSTKSSNIEPYLSEGSTNSINKNKKIHINVPDFRTTISREQVEKIKGVKGFPMAFIQPNFAIRWERPKTMAVYDMPKKNKPRNKQIIGIDSSINFDPNKIIDKVNNHVPSTVPNFDMMTSRPNKPGPLPSFMQKMYTRESAYCMTEKSLKENNYPNAKFMSATTSFWPKRSYNRIINLNLLNGQIFKNKKEKDETIEKQKNMVISSTKFYHQNFDDLLKEGYLNKFDNVTYKTIKHEHKIDPGDMEKFLLNFDNVDA